MGIASGARIGFAQTWKCEWPLLLTLGTSAFFLLGAGTAVDALMAPPWLALTFLWLFGTILAASKAAVRHVESLAHLLGEPYGTLVLTLAVTVIEVASISAVMLHGENNPTLVRDTVFSLFMIILNGMVGLALLIGGWKHREQHYNLQGANTYLSLIVPLAVLILILPDFTRTTVGPTLSVGQQIFLFVVALGLYGAFVAIQTGRHKAYFTDGDEVATHSLEPVVVDERGAKIARSSALLVAYLLPIIYLAEHLARPIDYLIETLRLPNALGGIIIGVLVAAPEALNSIKSAAANQLQRSMNTFLGSLLATIGLTIPAMLMMGWVTGRPFLLGLQHTDIVMLLLTLFSCGLTFSSGRTNVLQGLVHLLLFAAYILLIFQD